MINSQALLDDFPARQYIAAHHLSHDHVQDTTAAVPVQSPDTDAFALVPFEEDDDADEDGDGGSAEQQALAVVPAKGAGRRGGRARTKAGI